MRTQIHIRIHMRTYTHMCLHVADTCVLTYNGTNFGLFNRNPTLRLVFKVCFSVQSGTILLMYLLAVMYRLIFIHIAMVMC